MSLIDAVLPRFDFREVHRRPVRASCEAARAAVPFVDLSRSPYIAPLFALRSLPGRVARAQERKALQAGRLGDFFTSSFTPLIDAGPRGFVIGAIGEFWRMSGAMRAVTPATFARDDEARCARLAWAFEFEPRGAHCRVTTETRIACNDAHALARMRLYWIVIRPASGLIRREILRLLARDCEARR